MNLSVVIPVYNEVKISGKFSTSAIETLANEIIVVDDGS